MPYETRAPEAPAPVERRAAPLKLAFEERNLIPASFIDDVARAWTDAPQAADEASVHVGVFESYRDKAP
jgi:hypothetical protein